MTSCLSWILWFYVLFYMLGKRGVTSPVHWWLDVAGSLIHRQLTVAGTFQSFTCVFQPLMVCQQQISDSWVCALCWCFGAFQTFFSFDVLFGLVDLCLCSRPFVPLFLYFKVKICYSSMQILLVSVLLLVKKNHFFILVNFFVY